MEISAKFKDIIEKIEAMSVLELSDLVKVLEEKFGVSAASSDACGRSSDFARGEHRRREELVQCRAQRNGSPENPSHQSFERSSWIGP